MEEAKAFFDSFKKNSRVESIALENIGPAMGVHTGPKSLGLSILQLNK